MNQGMYQEEESFLNSQTLKFSIEYGFRIVSMGKKDFEKASSIGYCASQGMYYYGYKLHAVCGLSGVIHSFDLTKASVHDIHCLKDVKVITVIAD